MRIIVVGTGDLGFHVAKRFSEEHHDVVVVGRDDEALHWAQEVLDVSAVRGHGGSPSVLVEAGIGSADVIVAATSSDETNIVACLIAEAIAPSATRVARLHDPAYLGTSGIIDQSSLSIDYVISPEEEVAKAVGILASVPGASDALEFAGGRVMAVGVEIDEDCPLVGRPVTDLRRYDASRLLVAGVYRGELVQAPSSDLRLTPGDTVFLVGGRDAIRRAMTRLGKAWIRTRSAVIAGGGWEGVAVARRLSAAGIHTKIIERDPAVSDAIVHELDDTLVLLGDAHDQSLLVDEGVQRADLFVSALGSEADNIVVALLAKRLGCRRVMSLVDTPGHAAFASSVGVDSVVSPVGAALNTIVQLSRPGQIVTVRTLRENLVEGIEFVAAEGSGIVGLQLALLHMPHGSLVGAVVRDGTVIIPDSSTIVRADDRVVLFSRPALLPRLRRLIVSE
jgi:trk system potassium uptake protein TrkA